MAKSFNIGYSAASENNNKLKLKQDLKKIESKINIDSCYLQAQAFTELLKMNIEEIYHDTKSLVINDCEFTHQINQIMYSDKVKEEVKDETSGTTNIIVTKYADSSTDMLDVESSLHLDNKEKIIEVELLPSSIQHKSNFAALLNGAMIKKTVKKKAEVNDSKKFSQNSVKKKKVKQCLSAEKEFIKDSDIMTKDEFDQKNSEELVCSECKKQFSSLSVLKKHFSTCKVHTLGAALCSKCGKHFSSNYNLKRHMTSCKLCPDNERSPRFTCQCGRSYSQEWDMKKHRLKCKEGKKKCKRCLVSSCNLLFYHKAQLVAHMKKDHNMVIQDPKILNFNSFDEFLLWKEKEEEETFTYYSKQTGSNVSGVSVNTYYVCQHDGSDRTHTSAPRKTDRRNKKGRIKTGRLCWSQMNVKEFKDGTVKVTYFPSHTHPVSIADTEHHPLPSSISMEIKRRMSEMTKVSDNDELLSDENQDLRKGRKKRYNMSLRALRSLARKNRSLFRITAEAMQKPDGKKNSFEVKSNLQFTSLKNLPSSDNIMQVIVTDQEQENGDDPDPVQVFNVNGNDSQAKNELLQDCINYLNDVKAHLLSGKLPHSLVVQIKESLKTVCNLWENETQDPHLLSKPQNFSECQEVMMFQPQTTLPVGEMFPLQDEVNMNIEVNDDLKKLETPPEKAVYEIIAVDGEEKTSNEYLYQNTVVGQVVGPREFIIIATDHAQLFQDADSNVQFECSI